MRRPLPVVFPERRLLRPHRRAERVVVGRRRQELAGEGAVARGDHARLRRRLVERAGDAEAPLPPVRERLVREVVARPLRAALVRRALVLGARRERDGERRQRAQLPRAAPVERRGPVVGQHAPHGLRRDPLVEGRPLRDEVERQVAVAVPQRAAPRAARVGHGAQHVAAHAGVAFQ